MKNWQWQQKTKYIENKIKYDLLKHKIKDKKYQYIKKKD